jgi:hypothetical protein
MQYRSASLAVSSSWQEPAPGCQLILGPMMEGEPRWRIAAVARRLERVPHPSGFLVRWQLRCLMLVIVLLWPKNKRGRSSSKN